MSVEATPTSKASATAHGRRLESWKEIAAYLARDVTTVRRWEKGEGLPVHRHLHNKLGSVYAYTTELDAWRSNSQPQPWTRRIRAQSPSLYGGATMNAWPPRSQS
jgi:hypothetical protein